MSQHLLAIVNNNGIVFQKDLGPDSLDIVKDMKLYNPDRTWHRTDDQWPAGVAFAIPLRFYGRFWLGSEVVAVVGKGSLGIPLVVGEGVREQIISRHDLYGSGLSNTFKEGRRVKKLAA